VTGKTVAGDHIASGTLGFQVERSRKMLNIVILSDSSERSDVLENKEVPDGEKDQT
jgi:hypothetical protein